MAKRDGRLEVQGIVSAANDLPIVQFRQLERNAGEEEWEIVAEWQADVSDAREMAQQIIEASMNATYDAAMVAWTKETWPDEWQQMAAGFLPMIRKFRADTWGLPDQPEDWRN